MISRRAQPWLGTLVEIVAEGADDATRIAASDRAFARIAAIHGQMSFQDADSSLSHVNRAAQHDWVALPPDLAAVFAAALAFARASDGLFDPTVAARLVESKLLPRHAGFPAAATVDWRGVEFDGDRVRYAHPLLVDLSGIAKGYAVDVALTSLRDAGLSAATVNAGGDLARFGDSPTPLHVRLPRHPTRSVRLADLENGAAATSAGYFQPDALRDPRSGETLCAETSVTVLAPDCMTADALTKVVAADAAGATRLLARHGAQAVVLGHTRAMRSVGDAWLDLPLGSAA